ncbi:hypothetical protein [Cohnella hashimotonis]|uniref:Beta-galactosidase trimerisation domain-containing protein n=1 Tax=Cohnella hashimotonis TaxID=2826895 RepID=A0ABT6TG46_9BACL|nr:hypothetical protein [Cohnella hashimotonis]MDI4645816.1 hypothetical protein [Cohnella hashimotonis]
MKLHYSMAHEPLLDLSTRDALVANMKKAGIEKIWIAGFFSGDMIDLEELKQAKDFAEQNGLEIGALTIPIGHPGNSLNPDDPDSKLKIPEHWHYRIDNKGGTAYFCGAIDSCLIEDNGNAAKLLRDAGFKEVFLDDDLRVGNLNANIEGCYCDACITEFNAIYRRQETRETLSARMSDRLDTALMKDWVAFQCDKVTAVMKATDIEGVKPGIMVMHFGDERHGIDIAAIREEMPDTLFRVGEHQFTDRKFANPYAKGEEMLGIAYHLNFIDKPFAFSETTIFPPRSLKEHNLVYKAKLAIAAGLENILFMSGTWVMDDSYWKAIADALPVLRAFDHDCVDRERTYPVHLAYGTHGAYAESIIPTSLPVLAGLPVKPLRADQREDDGELLLFFGDYELTQEWQAKLPRYKQVIFDQKAVLKNKAVIEALKAMAFNLVCWEHEATSKPDAVEVSMLQARIGQDTREFPHIVEGGYIGLVWLKNSEKVILYNLLETENQGVVEMSGGKHPVRLKPLSFAVLTGSGSLSEYDTEIQL